ncbi:MAG: hypothetical protein JO166_07940 [Deltaproteobacteria bacterium]|nr:hypothetical protein [Deltaproteobacteria bacterium]
MQPLGEFFGTDRWIAAVLDASDEIGEVTREYIEIWKLRRDRQGLCAAHHSPVFTNQSSK